MKLRFQCTMLPNGTVGRTKFREGFAEVDSVDTDEVNELMASPFVQCLANNLENVRYGEEVPESTMRNRLSRMTKLEVIEFAENLGIPCGDKSLPIKFFTEKIIAVKYPAKE